MWILAHRGAPTPAPGAARPVQENSLAAFAAARRLGADGVELDVRRARDGALVVHHDTAIPGRGPIANLERDALPSSVPSLPDALAACAGMVVDVEVKHDAAADPDRRCASGVGELLARHGTGAAAPVPARWPSAVLVSSFDAASLDAVVARAPHASTGLLVAWDADAAQALETASAHGCAAIHPFVTQVDGGLVAAAHERGMAVNVWTVNADADLAAMVRLKVDGIITDRVRAAVDAVRRGGWNGGGAAPSSTIEA